MIFKNELPLDHEPSLDYMAKAWADENVEEALAEEARGFDSYYQSDWDYEYEMSRSVIEDDLEEEGLEWEEEDERRT